MSLRSVAVLFVLAFAAGCVGAPSVQPASVVAPSLAPAHLLSYDGNGTLLASPPDELAGGLTFVERLLKNRGGEPNIGVDPKGNVFVTANNNVMKSSDHGKTWSIVFNLTTAFPSAVQGTPLYDYTRSSDSMLWVDPITGRVFADFMTSLLCSNMVISSDAGASWTMKPMTCGLPVNDHQKVMTAPFAKGDGALPASPIYPDVVYYCYNKLLDTHCAVSFDGGETFPVDRPITNAAFNECGGINGHPAPAPDGTVYVPINLGCAGPVVVVTTDNGLTWTVQNGPTKTGAEEIDPDITVTPDGTAYMLYRGADHLQYLVRSHDKFKTWSGPWRVSPPDVKSTVFTVITSLEDGRIAMAYLGNRDTTDEPSKAGNTTRWHLFVTYSTDAASAEPTFTTQQATPDDDPLQIGCVWLGGGGNPCRNMLDFIDMTADPDGRVFVAVTDGCTDGCAHNTAAKDTDSHKRDGGVYVLDAGPSLLAAKGKLSPP